MAEQFLDDAQVRAAVEQVRGEAMAERVRRDPERQAGPRPEAFEPEPEATHADRRAPVIEEDLRWIGRASFGLREEYRTPIFEVGLEGRTRRPAQQTDTLLASLADHPDLAAAQVQIRHGRGGELADPQTGRVRGLDDRPVAEDQRVMPGGAGFFVDGRQEPLDLLDLEDPWQPPRQPGRRQRAPRIAGGQAGPGAPSIEGTERREPLGDRRPGMPEGQVREVRPQFEAPRRMPVSAPVIEPGEISADGEAAPAMEGVGEVCPECGAEHGGTLIARRGRFGPFVGCDRYPECKYIKKTGPPPPDPLAFEVACPKCKSGHLTARRARRTGSVFWGCSRYPKCDFTTSREPLGAVHDADGGAVAREGETGVICLACGATIEVPEAGIVPGAKLPGGPANPQALVRPGRGGRSAGGRPAGGRARTGGAAGGRARTTRRTVRRTEPTPGA